MGIQYNCSRFASFQCLLIPPVSAHIRKRWKRNIQVNGERNSARGPYVSFLETRNAQGGTSIVSWVHPSEQETRKEPDMNVSFPMKLAWQAVCSFLFLRWKRSTWISKVSFGFRFNSVPQSKCTSRDFSEDQPGSRFSWCDNGNFDRKWSSRSNTWGSSTTVRDLPLFSAY